MGTNDSRAISWYVVLKLKDGTPEDYRVFEDAMKTQGFLSVIPPDFGVVADPEVLPAGMYVYKAKMPGPVSGELTWREADARVTVAGNQAAAQTRQLWGYMLFTPYMATVALELANQKAGADHIGNSSQRFWSMSTALSPANVDFGNVRIGTSVSASVNVVGHSFTQGEVAVDGQDRAAFAAQKTDQSINVTFSPRTGGGKFARLKVLIETDGPPYWVEAQLHGQGV